MKKILVFFVAMILFCLLYILLAYAFLPLSEKWLSNVYQIKKELIKNTKGKRIIVVGGSSSLFGLNGKVIKSNISQSYNFINLATHAGLPMSYHIDQVLHFAQKGDIVIMPLEFSYYTKKEPYDDAWYIQNILSWDKNYRKYITYENIFLTLLQTKLRDFLAPIKSLLFKNESPIYSSKNLNQWGDFCIQQTSQFGKKDHFSYLEDKPILSQFFISEIKRAKQKLNAIGANLVLTYPPTLQNTHFDLNQKIFTDSIDYIKIQLSNIGIEIIGEAKDFHYPPNLFLDTQYHLNCEGSIKRSEDFSRVLNQWLKTR